MRLYIIILLNTIILGQLMGQEKKYIRQGNSSYESQDFEKSELKYRKALEKNTNSFDAGFNLGDALFKQEKYEEAAKKFEELAYSDTKKENKAKAFHNLGNTMLQTQKLEEGVEAYKNALRNNPKDEETRYNLAYAQKMLKQQQEQEKKDQDKDKEIPPLTEFAKSAKARADNAINNKKYSEAYSIISSALKKDASVENYKDYISRLEKVSKIN